MFPDTIEVFNEITLETYDNLVEGEMTELNAKLDALPAQMTDSVVGAMYGNMEIHDDTMDIFDTNGVLIRTFNLYDVAGNPTTSSAVYKREIKIIEEPIV